MPQYSQISKERLSTAHYLQQYLWNEIIRYWDVTIVCGFRNQVEQDAAYAKGASTKCWPNSKHNTFSPIYPTRPESLAVDVAPYDARIHGINWGAIEEFKNLGFFVLGFAASKGIEITWGADWNKNYLVSDEKFKDLGHFELVLLNP